MKIPCTEISLFLKDTLRSDVLELEKRGVTPKLVTILVGSAPEQLSFVNIKRRIAAEIGVEFELVHLSTPPPFPEFQSLVREKAEDTNTSGIIIQHPFPQEYDIQKVYECIPPHKEIEGFHPESHFRFPLSLAVLSGIKYVMHSAQNESNPIENTIVSFEDDKPELYDFLKAKRIVIAGRGLTGGAPIAQALSDMGVAYQVTHSQTADGNEIYKTADLIITATGSKIISSDTIRDGVILLNVGLRKEEGKLKGDYDEVDISEKAAYYTQTPGGLGPLDVLYLFKNVIEAAQK